MRHSKAAAAGREPAIHVQAASRGWPVSAKTPPAARPVREAVKTYKSACQRVPTLVPSWGDLSKASLGVSRGGDDDLRQDTVGRRQASSPVVKMRVASHAVKAMNAASTAKDSHTGKKVLPRSEPRIRSTA